MSKLIEVEAVMVEVKTGKKTKEKKLSHFRGRIGDKTYDPLPFGYLRISELPTLEQMLREAYQLGAGQVAAAATKLLEARADQMVTASEWEVLSQAVEVGTGLRVEWRNHDELNDTKRT